MIAISKISLEYKKKFRCNRCFGYPSLESLEQNIIETSEYLNIWYKRDFKNFL